MKGAKTRLVRGQKFIILEVLLDHLKMAHSSIFEKTGRTEMGLRCLRCSPTKQDVLGLIPGRAYFFFFFSFFLFFVIAFIYSSYMFCVLNVYILCTVFICISSIPNWPLSSYFLPLTQL